MVLVIAAALMTIAPPLISKALPGAQLKSATRQLAAGLRYARNHALTSDEEAILMLDVETRAFNITGRKRQYHLADDLEVTLETAESEMVSEHKGAIRFFPNGGATGGRISVSNGKRKFAVDVDWLTGKVRVLEADPDV